MAGRLRCVASIAVASIVTPPAASALPSLLPPASRAPELSSKLVADPSSATPPTVSVFWDLDNKPPRYVPPYDAALRLRRIAQGFGSVVDMVAYANRHAFTYVPNWVKEKRKDRKALDVLEVRGLVLPDEPYRCDYCGRKCKTHAALVKHFKQLHERERKKRLSRLDSLKGKRKMMYKDRLADTERKYKEAAKDIITPKVGYGLGQELRRAGVWVKTVSDKPQAADEALKKHILQSIVAGIDCICLVSDDSDFSDVLKRAQSTNLRTVVVGDTSVLWRYADICFSWADVSSGGALRKATEAADHWYGHQWVVDCHWDSDWLRKLQQNIRGEVGAQLRVDCSDIGPSFFSDGSGDLQKLESQNSDSSDGDEINIWWTEEEEE